MTQRLFQAIRYRAIWRTGSFLAVLLCMLGANAAEWSEQKKNQVTQYMQQYRRDWTSADTQLMSQGTIVHSTATVYIENRPVNLRLMADDGRLVPVEVLGQSILVDGKDLSGNLGSKTTQGANSPIIENVTGSQIATGQGSSVMKDSTSSVTINVSLSIALSASVALNLYLLRKIRQRTSTPKRATRRS